MTACGQVLDEWQRLLVRMTLATKDGRLAASEVGALVARQNGKGGWLEAVAIWALFMAGGTTMWTAHELKTSDEAHQRIQALIKAQPDLSAEVVRWDGGLTGQHIIELRSGARLAFVARSKSSGRGLSPQRIFFDEAQEFSRLAFRALMFATSAQGAKRQLIYTGTVPGPENNAEIWTGARDRGRSAEPKKLAWAEWTPEGSDKAGAAIDPTSWAARAWANPALGERILPETLDEEWDACKDSDVEGFLQERLSVWPTLDASTGVVDGEAWKACKAALIAPAAPVILAVETVTDRSSSSVVAVGSGRDDRAQVKVLRSASGTAWVPALVVRVAKEHPEVEAIVIDGRAAAASLLDAITVALESAGVDVDVVVTNSSDVAQGCGQIMDAIRDGTIRHAGDPTLDAAVRGAVQRDMGDGAWAWSRRKGGPVVAPLVAMTLAHWKWQQLMDAPSPMSQIF